MMGRRGARNSGLKTPFPLPFLIIFQKWNFDKIIAVEKLEQNLSISFSQIRNKNYVRHT